MEPGGGAGVGRGPGRGGMGLFDFFPGTPSMRHLYNYLIAGELAGAYISPGGWCAAPSSGVAGDFIVRWEELCAP